ncbi:hypothetical protein HK101_009299 [Irineochytrium annulatum]|nr:hypothetical protein HK101_009299 [Irineochytrium annulatum]
MTRTTSATLTVGTPMARTFSFKRFASLSRTSKEPDAPVQPAPPAPSSSSTTLVDSPAPAPAPAQQRQQLQKPVVVIEPSSDGSDAERPMTRRPWGRSAKRNDSLTVPVVEKRDKKGERRPPSSLGTATPVNGVDDIIPAEHQSSITVNPAVISATPTLNSDIESDDEAASERRERRRSARRSARLSIRVSTPDSDATRAAHDLDTAGRASTSSSSTPRMSSPTFTRSATDPSPFDTIDDHHHRPHEPVFKQYDSMPATPLHTRAADADAWRSTHYAPTPAEIERRRSVRLGGLDPDMQGWRRYVPAGGRNVERVKEEGGGGVETLGRRLSRLGRRESRLVSRLERVRGEMAATVETAIAEEEATTIKGGADGGGGGMLNPVAGVAGVETLKRRTTRREKREAQVASMGPVVRDEVVKAEERAAKRWSRNVRGGRGGDETVLAFIAFKV